MIKNFLSKNQDLLKNITFGFLCSLLVLGFSVLLASLFYQPKKMVKRGFEVEIKVATSEQNPTEEQVKGVKIGNLADLTQNKKSKPMSDIAEMIENADITAGEKIFKKCATCHTITKGGANKVGPNLYGIVGKNKASIVGFAYSDALKKKGGAWTITDINQWLTKPKDFVPGTKMGFAGLSKDKDRANVIAYLKQQSK